MQQNVVVDTYVYLALTDDKADMASFSDEKDCIQYLISLGLSPDSYIKIPFDPVIPYKKVYKIFDGYVQYLRGDITLINYAVYTSVTHVTPVNIIQPAPGTGFDNGAPITWYCKIMVRSDIINHCRISYNEFIKKSIINEVEKRLINMINNEGGVICES